MLWACAAPQAIQNDYYFQFFYDDLPIWGYVGKVERVKGEWALWQCLARRCCGWQQVAPAQGQT